MRAVLMELKETQAIVVQVLVNSLMCPCIYYLHQIAHVDGKTFVFVTATSLQTAEMKCCTYLYLLSVHASVVLSAADWNDE